MATNFEINAFIPEDWYGGYKLEVDLTAESDANNWKLDFNLPYTIREVYGVKLTDNGDGSYSIEGLDSQTNLQQGQSLKAIFIIDENQQEAIIPEFIDSVSIDSLDNSESVVEEESVDNSESVVAEEPVDNSEPVVEEESVDNSESVVVEESVDNSEPVVEEESVDNSESVVVEEPVDSSEPVVEDELNQFPFPDNQGESVGQQGQFAYGEALQKNFLFYEANRSGDLGPDNRLEWRQDSTLNDGSTVGRDLEGGYFDAGDHVKFGQPMAASMNMLAWGGVEYKQAYQQSGQFDELLDAVKWGTDYFLKAHETDGNGNTSKLWVQVGEGGSNNDHGYWGAPETVEANTTRNAFAIDPANPGSDVAASTSSAFAAASMLFRGVDDAYADQLLKNAEQLYEFAETYQGKYSDSVSAANPFYTSWSGYGDELASGAAWLHKATGEESYLTKAENYFKDNFGGLGDWSWATDDHSYSAAVILAQESEDPFFQDQVEGWLDKWINGEGAINYTSGGLAHRTAWGSIPLASATAFLAELYNDTVKEDSRYSDFANDQVDYILGDNPRDYSYMIGFGDNYPQRPHHRGSAPNLGGQPTAVQENILYGAVVGGPDAPDDYAHNDRRDDWVSNEVGISYNAPFASALIQQYDNFGGDALSNSELDQLIGVDANGVGF